MKELEISLAFSPCPNDTFIFDALVNNKIDTEGLQFNYAIEDVETLNKAAFTNKYDVSKLSFHAFYKVLTHYACLTSGAALCDDFGPIIIGKRNIPPLEFKNMTLAVPGLLTTANLIFNHFFEARQCIPFFFSEIENAVLTNKADIGIVIHENVFSFKKKNLFELQNLGKLWQKNYNLPIPLGCIAVKRSLPEYMKQKINGLIKKSIIYAFENPNASYNFVKKNVQGTPDDIIQKHINTYVNDYSISMNDKALTAIMFLYNDLISKKAISDSKVELFINKRI